MKKKLLIGFSSFVFLSILMINVSLSSETSGNIFSLSSLQNIAFADDCEARTIAECPGGTCEYHNPNTGECCVPCCVEGQNPYCGTYECGCE